MPNDRQTCAQRACSARDVRDVRYMYDIYLLATQSSLLK